MLLKMSLTAIVERLKGRICTVQFLNFCYGFQSLQLVFIHFTYIGEISFNVLLPKRSYIHNEHFNFLRHFLQTNGSFLTSFSVYWYCPDTKLYCRLLLEHFFVRDSRCWQFQIWNKTEYIAEKEMSNYLN